MILTLRTGIPHTGITNIITIITNRKKIDFMQPRYDRKFSENKHSIGQWKTRVFISRHPLIRAATAFCSLKRAGVDNLAKANKKARIILDAGAGGGAYSHWYLGRAAHGVCIAVDWSENALRRIAQPQAGVILPVCADLRFLPFRSLSIDALFSIDTLGHINRCESALDEFARVCKSGADLFVHSECRDYQSRWPDRNLIKILGDDTLARSDGHDFLKYFAELYEHYCRRFQIKSFVNPAGYFGFILGYPEKYKPAFLKAHWRFWGLLAGFFSVLKKTPVIGLGLRAANALTNHCEIFLRLKGGGSCFAELKKF
jgi:ubiquinone/menaquinone biosynthesis C-methylase UbiE